MLLAPSEKKMYNILFPILEFWSILEKELAILAKMATKNGPNYQKDAAIDQFRQKFHQFSNFAI